jgi:thiosulfate/3-mercaptopyruvate sulfurtransferase
MHTTLIRPSDLAPHLADSRWVVVDCRFDLTNPAWGEEQYMAGHVPGARYAHLDRDLSGPMTGTNGRHPLPSLDEMTARFSALGIGPGRQVAAYDADSGMYAARLWWMLRFMGHDAAAVLDGGFARWAAEGGAIQPGRVIPTPAAFQPQPRAAWRLTVDEVVQMVEAAAKSGAFSPSTGPALVDARSPERFRGVNETLDKVGGHIPGARNYFFQQNLTDEKTFRPAAELRAQWNAVLAGCRPENTVMYCGSGVTACHNLLAMEAAGLPGARLFPGSWSEWCADAARPVER